jgi:hypothetical protein
LTRCSLPLPLDEIEEVTDHTDMAHDYRQLRQGQAFQLLSPLSHSPTLSTPRHTLILVLFYF